MEYSSVGSRWTSQMKACIFGVTISLILASLVQAEYPAVYPPEKQRKVSYACQNSYIHLSCKRPGERIRILLANYGRFSLVVCNQAGIHEGWNTQCKSLKSIQVVSERCDGHKNCSFMASNQLFGDPCPGTKKYIEVRYHCEKAIETKNETSTTADLVTSTAAPSTEVKVVTQESNTGGVTEKWINAKKCSSTEKASIYWPETTAGVLLEKTCPDDMTGYASWQCDKNGEWAGEPNLANCVSPWILNIQKMLKDNVPAEKTIGKLNSEMRGKKMGSGDLREASAKVIPGLVAKMKHQMHTDKTITADRKKEMVHSFSKEIVKTGSGLLDDKQQASWDSLTPEVRKISATSLIVSLEQMALEVAATIEGPNTVSSSEQNIVMEVSVLKMSESKSEQNLQLPRIPYDTGVLGGQQDFTLPLDGLTGISSTDDITVTYLFYNNLESLMNPGGNGANSSKEENSSRIINTNIISASLMKHSSKATKRPSRIDLKRPMNFTLAHKNNLKDKIPLCAYWKYNESTLIGEWCQDGCQVVETNDEFTTCQCTHLTNFAVLFDVAGTEMHRLHELSLRAITYVGCSVSVICLLMCLISFSIFRNLESDRNTIHKNLVLCLMVAELLFLFGIGQTDNKVTCSIIAAFLHFFFLTSFSWMCLEGIQLYFMLIEVFEAERSRVRWFYAFGYGVPALIVAISAAVDHTGYGTDKHCWLRTDNYFILSFVVPAAVVILINIVMLSIAVYMMCRHAGVTASSIQSRQKSKLEKMGRNGGNNTKYSIASDTSTKTPLELPTWLKGSAVLVVLLGLTWMFGFMYVSADTVIMAYIFTILNSLQGLFIFIFHCFMDRKVKKEWRRAIYKAKWLPVCCRVNLGGYNGNLSSPTPTSSSGPQNYFLRFWSSRKRKRSSTSSNSTKNRRSDLDSFLRSDTSSGCTTGTGVNRYSNQSDKLLPNGQNPYSAMPTHYEGGVNGDLSVVDASVIDSEYVTEYCQQAMQVSMEKRRYSSGSEDMDNDVGDNVSHDDSISKNRLSFLSMDSALKVNSECTSENEEGKVNYAVLENDEAEAKSNRYETGDTESDRNLLNDILTLYENVKGKNGTSGSPTERICSSQDKLDNKTIQSSGDDKSKTKSAPDLKNRTQNVSYSKPVMDRSTKPILGSLPDLSTIGEEDAEIDANPCSKSAILGTRKIYTDN